MTYLEKMTPGNKVKLDFGENNPNIKTMRILAVIEKHVVFKWWSRHK
jgi:hypothetical protein